MNLNQLRREAVFAAEDVLAGLGGEDGAKVPVFDLIEDRGIWLSFQPLDRLLGVYQRVGDVAGIALNVGRPIAMQRFTAAHELGHHELGHASHVDDEASIEGRTSDPKELQAQTFAASLLMSELAVEDHLERMGHNTQRPSLTPTDIYQISVELGVSYTAAVTQLRTLSKISQPVADAAYKVTPLSLKTKLLGGRRPDNPRAAVWRLGLADNHRHLDVDLGDELDLGLPEILSTGYEWVAALDGAFATMREWTEASSQTQYGDQHVRHLTLKAREPGEHRLSLELKQPWHGGDTGATLDISVRVAAGHVSAVGRGISVNQQPQLLVA